MGNRIDEMKKAWQTLQSLAGASRSARGTDAQDKSALEKLPSPKFVQYPPLLPTSGMPPGPKASSSARSSAKPVQPDGTEPEEGDSSAEMSSPPALSSRSAPKSTAEHLAGISSVAVELPDLPPEDDAGVSAGSAPVTPRTEKAAAAGHGEKLKKLRKKASKRLSKVTIDLSEMVQKLTPRSGRNSPEKTSPRRKALPKKDDPRLAGLPIAERNKMAVEMAAFCETPAYCQAPPARQSLMFNAKLIGLLNDDYPDCISDEQLKALRADLDWRMKNAFIDKTIDLADAVFRSFVEGEINDRFINTWNNEKAGEEGEKEFPAAKGKLTKTFLRDFSATSHWLRNASGDLEEIKDPLVLVNFLGGGTAGELPRRVSHVANQNMTTFLNAVLFRRKTNEQVTDSVLHLWNDDPVTPRGNMRPKYIYSKNAAGNPVVDIEYFCSKESTRPEDLGVIHAAEVLGKKRVSAEAELRVRVRVIFEQDGNWTIEDPHVFAKGWNVTIDD